MSPEKYEVKLNGERVWRGLAQNENEAKQFTIIDHPDLKADKDKLTAEIQQVSPASGNEAGKPRKDKGSKHQMAEKPTKKHRTVYHLILGEFTIQDFESKQTLDASLDGLEDLDKNLKVIDGGTLRNVQKRFVLTK